MCVCVYVNVCLGVCLCLFFSSVYSATLSFLFLQIGAVCFLFGSGLLRLQTIPSRLALVFHVWLFRSRPVGFLSSPRLLFPSWPSCLPGLAPLFLFLQVCIVFPGWVWSVTVACALRLSAFCLCVGCLFVCLFVWLFECVIASQSFGPGRAFYCMFGLGVAPCSCNDS